MKSEKQKKKSVFTDGKVVGTVPIFAMEVKDGYYSERD